MLSWHYPNRVNKQFKSSKLADLYNFEDLIRYYIEYVTEIRENFEFVPTHSCFNYLDALCDFLVACNFKCYFLAFNEIGGHAVDGVDLARFECCLLSDCDYLSR